jgi:predicted small secreted protein
MKLITLLGTMLLLAACNTMHGLGTDIRHLGTNLEGAAKERHGEERPQQTPSPLNTMRVQQNYPVQPLEGRELETIPYDKY